MSDEKVDAIVQRLSRHWTPYVKANFTKNVDYWTNKRGDLSTLTYPVLLKVNEKMLEAGYTQPVREQLRAVRHQLEEAVLQERRFNYEQRLSMYQID